MNRMPAIVAVLTGLLLVLTVTRVITSVPTNSGGFSAELVMPTPPHHADYKSICDELRRHGFRYGYKVMGSGPKLVVSSTDFKRARAIVVNYSRRHALTLRIARDSSAAVWEIWERGTKQREETYLISASRSP